MALSTRVDPANTFRLHSNPTATKTIYLDFDGHATTGSAWNTKTRPAITTPAFNTDKDSSKFSGAELERIQFIWQRVAEDFAPFGINVTTEDPGDAALANSGRADTAWGVRVVIGGSSSDWYGGSAGGAALLSSFGNPAVGCCFVFPKNLGNGNEKYTAEDISHEAGHTLGLRHDGTSSTSYYGGQGGKGAGWAPIMGSSLYKLVTQWSQGEYSGANNKEDDLAIIAANVGFRSDDFGDTAATAATLSGCSLSQFGTITSRTDCDWFRFSTASGLVNLTITTALQAWVRDFTGGFTSRILAGRSPNLDIAATLHAADGTVVASSNPLDKLSASFNLNLDAGTYFLKVDGVGFGDPLNNGYSDYGSLGGYWVSGRLA